MYTIVETPTFTADADDLWSEDERAEFCVAVASNPEIGVVIPRSGGCRKVRWKAQGKGKQGGSRIIYFNRLENGEIWLLLIYPKSVTDNIPAHILKAIREAIENG